jgi:transcription elongation factor Elf1
VERLLFVCPRTEKLVDIGVASELQTLLRIKTNTVRIRCAWCGERHQWKIRDAQLARAA